MKLLHLDSSILGDNSASRALSAAIVARWKGDMPGLEVLHRDLAGEHALPHLDGASLSKADPTEAARSARALEDFLAADVIVIGAPMYNFGIPSQLKAWIDRVMIAGRTFRYTAEGPQGLAGGKTVIIASARGGFYGEGSPVAAWDHQESYLTTLFGFLGVTDVRFLRAEGVNVSPEQKEKAIAEARGEVASLVAAQPAAQQSAAVH